MIHKTFYEHSVWNIFTLLLTRFLRQRHPLQENCFLFRKSCYIFFFHFDFLAPPISTCQSKAENELIHPNWDISHTLQILSIRIVDVFLKSNHNSLSICVILVHTYTLATSSLYVEYVKEAPFGKNWRNLNLQRKKVCRPLAFY